MSEGEQNPGVVSTESEKYDQIEPSAPAQVSPILPKNDPQNLRSRIADALTPARYCARFNLFCGDVRQCRALASRDKGSQLIKALKKVAGASSVSIALPTIGRELGIPEERIQWIVSAFALTSVGRC